MKKSDHVGRITESNYTKVGSSKQVFDIRWRLKDCWLLLNSIEYD